MSTKLSPFQQEAQKVIAKANTLGFAFDFESKLSKVTWGYTEEVNSRLIKSIEYVLQRNTHLWVILARTKYNFVTDETNGVYLKNLGQLPWNQTEFKEEFVCSIVL